MPLETAFEELPICPKCKDRIDDWWEFKELDGDGCQVQTECSQCGGYIVITMCVSTSFQTVYFSDKEIEQQEKNNAS